MKTFKYFIACMTVATALTGSISLTGCTNLDEQGYTFLDPNTFYTTESEINATLNGVYNRFRNMYSRNSQLYIAQIELLSDQGVPTYNKNNMELINKWSDANNASAKNGVHVVWASAYETVNRANIVLGRIDQIEMDATRKNWIKGQAYFLRGYSFFQVLRLFGAAVLPLTYTDGLENLEMGRSTMAETYDQIIKDLEEAENLLPTRGTSGFDVWRVSKGAAQAALGEVYIYRASMADVNGEQAKATEYWTKARDKSKAVMDSNVYSLMPEYTDQFYWFNPSGAKNNSESVFELQYSANDKQSNDMHIRFGLGRTNTDYMGCYQYARMGVSPYIYIEMLNNGDKRADVFLTYFEGKGNATDPAGTAYTFNPETMHWGTVDGEGKWNTNYITNDRNAEHRCVFNCKYFDNHTAFDLQKPCANFPIIRYSEVLLNYAEAANKVSGGSGLTELNAVRARAGLAAFSGDADAIDEEIFNQRRFEFVGEGKIFYDELRRDVLAERSAAKLAQGFADKLTYFDVETPLFSPKKSYLFPIPQGDLDSNAALKDQQNPVNEPKSLK